MSFFERRFSAIGNSFIDEAPVVSLLPAAAARPTRSSSVPAYARLQLEEVPRDVDARTGDGPSEEAAGSEAFPDTDSELEFESPPPASRGGRRARTCAAAVDLAGLAARDPPRDAGACPISLERALLCDGAPGKASPTDADVTLSTACSSSGPCGSDAGDSLDALSCSGAGLDALGGSGAGLDASLSGSNTTVLCLGLEQTPRPVAMLPMLPPQWAVVPAACVAIAPQLQAQRLYTPAPSPSSAPPRAAPAPAAATAEEETATTLMVRNLPLSMTQRSLLDELNRHGFVGAYDFCYLPTFPESKGIAFVNFTSPLLAAAFRGAWDGLTRSLDGAEVTLSVVPAAVQGLEANYQQFARRRARDPRCKPFFFVPGASRAVGNGKEPAAAAAVGGRRRPKGAAADAAKAALPVGLQTR